MARPPFNSPLRDPCDSYVGFRERVESDTLSDDCDDEFDDGYVECDFCGGRRATMTSPDGWPICDDCAKERESPLW